MAPIFDGNSALEDAGRRKVVERSSEAHSKKSPANLTGLCFCSAPWSGDRL